MGLLYSQELKQWVLTNIWPKLLARSSLISTDSPKESDAGITDNFLLFTGHQDPLGHTKPNKVYLYTASVSVVEVANAQSPREPPTVSPSLTESTSSSSPGACRALLRSAPEEYWELSVYSTATG